MRAAKKTSLDRKILQELVPLNALSPQRFKEVSEKILVEEVKSGRYLFRKGDRDNRSIYLLEGKINLIDGFRKIASEVESGTDMSRYPISNMQPRTVSARAARKSIIASIDSSLLDAFLTWDQSNSAEAVEISADENSDWMTRMLQSEAFMKIPPAMIQRLLMKMQSVDMRTGETVIRQGDEGDYFYTIQEGRCAVTCRGADDAGEQQLAELGEGDSFGEESLVSDTKRNATVAMLTDGVLLRLAKEDFVALLQEPLMKRVSYETAVAMVNEGAVWVDVRTQDEYEVGSFEDSVNIPLADLRGELSELVFNAQYVMCCDTGRRSGSAAFLLSHKGFDVYLLDGGIAGLHAGALEQAGMPAGSAMEADESCTETGGQLAEVIDFEEGLHAVVDVVPDDETCGAAAMPADAEPVEVAVESPETAGLEAEVEALRSQNETLRRDLEQNLSTEVRLTEQLELLRGELGESGEKLATLYSKAREDSDENQRLHADNATLQESHARQLQSMQSELDEARQQLDGLQSQANAASEQRQQLQDEVAAGEQASQAEILQLQEELTRAGARIKTLEADLSAASETLPAEHAAVLQEQRERIAALEDALEQAGREHEQARSELAASKDERETSENGLRSEMQERVALSERLGEELADTQQQFNEVAGDLAAAVAHAEELEAHNTELTTGIESMQQQLDDGRQQLEQQAVAAEQERQTLQQELENLRAAQREAGVQMQEQEERADNMAAGCQAAEEALQHQLADWEAERARYNEDGEALRNSVEELRGELATAQEQAATEKAGLEELLQQLRSDKEEQLEQYEVQLVELQNDKSRQAGELREMQEERDNWQQQYNAQAEENSQLQQEVSRINEQVVSLAGSADEQLQALHSELDTGQRRIADLDQAGADKDAQLVVLQEELAGREADISEAARQQEQLHQQLEALQQELAERDERTRLVEQENQESIRKAHEDLTRKNDNEKELQGQLVRMRKKLEQAALEQQEVRESAQTDVDNIREELHSERQARAEERAEMAARQRELKEQLAAVASEHETNLNNQSGAIEDARDSAREEERVRMRDLLQHQEQMEEQLQKLQQELQQAHAENARQHLQEKEHRQAGSDLLHEQNCQAEEAIGQLESQLKQLTQERDQSLEEQQELREKLNVLRGEVEISRGLINVGQEGHVEDPVQLRNELEETRKNVEISVRLRAEAESARDQLIQERDALRDLLESRPDIELPLHVPSLDEEATGSSHTGSLHKDNSRVNADSADVTSGEAATEVPEVPASRKHSWFGSVLGVVLVGISALMLWLMLGIEDAPQQPGSAADNAIENPVTQDEIPAAATVSPEPIKETPPVAAALTAEPVAGEPPAPAVQPAPAARPGVTEPVTVVPPVVPAPVMQIPEVQKPAVAPAPAPIAGTGFRDTLKNGGKGPLMVELPGTSFMMGSSGNSLNFEEGPRHEVTLTGFSIGRHEVSFAEYDRFARASGRRLPHDESWGRKDRPVINVSWHDANAYAAWLSRQTGKTYRLPTESEWEYSIRAGTTDQYWWGNSAGTVPANCFNCGSRWDGYRTAPVGSFGANNFGLHDMAGNVQEWTQDCYHAGYAGAPLDGSAWLTPECTQRAVRGGAYTSPQDTLRSAKRGQYDQDTRLDNLGFRVVREN